MLLSFMNFFEINDLKGQLQAKTTLICNLKNRIRSVKEASNEAKVKNDIDVIETINIELEHICRNADLKAQIQEKVFANAALKNELRKLKGNNVDTKFAKSSILGKPPLQPSRNHLVVRQPTAFTKSAPAKPHHVNAPSSSRNSKKESYGSNDMTHTSFLEEGRKKTQDRNRIPNPRDMASARTHRTPNACTPKPRNISRCFHVSKSSCVPSNVVPLVDHSRKSSSFSDSKHFVCSNCQKCVFNANHNAYVTKFLNEVNSRARKPSHKTTTCYKPVEKTSNTMKSLGQILTGHMFSTNKSFAVQKKTNNPRSCLRGNQRVECLKLLA
ncbi:hypothetical protein Tco_0322670 [Tanacetum coccineum]